MRELRASDWASLVRPHRDLSMRLFCFPYAGGGPSVFRTWPTALGDVAEVWALRLPGRQSRLGEDPAEDADAVAESVAEGLIADDRLDRPFAFYGHSVGALLAFLVTRVLEDAGSPVPAVLVPAARRAPQLVRIDPRLSDLPDDALADRLVELDGTPPSVLEDRGLLEVVLPALRADFRMSEQYSYRPREPLSVPILALGGRNDSLVPAPDIERWRVQTRGFFGHRMIPGGHFFIHEEEATLLAVIRAILEVAPTGAHDWSAVVSTPHETVA